MEQRKSLYRDVHKGIRRLMFDLVSRAGRTDFNDPAAVSMLRAEARSCFELLSIHAHHENVFNAPLVTAYAPHLSHLVAPAHDEHELEIEALTLMLERLDDGHSSAATAGHELVVRLSRFFGDLFVHMADEEEQIMPALWKAMTDEEIAAVEHQIVAAIAPDRLARFLSWMLPAMNHPERVEMLEGMQQTASPEVFTFVLDLSRSVLTSGEMEAIERSLSIGTAA